ncbi:uncharacterized protein ASCRUDRAFT_69513 [Ascoidea rubescens DSM 1968]|uniref:Non-canonical E2 ubiquitin-conjugating enzyme C-terminal domain-containing protein n=1 Tax=Ascoidea rubescens DSM 1968 TaxID=1344418 RepID=A0A1D2VJI2_9ASCO|nr:hypothetical protein ASCRUDRAFT_69513 [Ascoidea rubescens DSM 1968]ODV61776.1 hypothetical protein ASCRUDRAFT_69513 [Ascoidea rubescens DSM 1968]
MTMSSGPDSKQEIAQPNLTDILENDDVDLYLSDKDDPLNKIDDVSNEFDNSDLNNFRNNTNINNGTVEHNSENCVECTDMPIEVHCKECDEDFCRICFKLIHNSGKRGLHNITILKNDNTKTTNGLIGKKDQKTGNNIADGNKNQNEDEYEYSQEELAKLAQPFNLNDNESIGLLLLKQIKIQSKYIPLRLNHKERELFRLLNAALTVSEYTDKIDIFSYGSKTKKIVATLKELCSILCGLVISKNFKIGSELILDKNFKDNEDWFKNIFEIGRRYKIMNPNRFNDNFGKLCYIIMDSRLPDVKNLLEFDFYKPITTIYNYLNSREDKKILEMFDNPLLLNAVSEISPINKSRREIQKEIKIKEYSIEKIASTYSNGNGFNKEEIKQAIYSIGDYHTYINSNRKPIDRMIKRLKKFDSKVPVNEKIVGKYSLTIRAGRKNSRLSHDHTKQYDYVLQSLNLWSVVQKEMFQLWSLADDDLFNDQVIYKLVSTGQGLNRVKSCPSVHRKMYQILNEVKQKSGFWIGSSYIHLGDTTVPNALFFLDKYLQVPKIISPIDNTLLKLESDKNEEIFKKDKFLTQMIEEQYGGFSNLQLQICSSFFTEAFNGSGGDDWFNAGSCIDGRLTSTWEWANNIHKKDYHKFFLLSGFNGFN